MKKWIFTIVFMMSLLLPVSVNAAPPEFSGGVNDEYEYEEVVFLSGQAVNFTGKYTFSEREKGDTTTVTYQFKLIPKDRTVSGKLDRKISYEVVNSRRDDRGQTIAQTELKSYKETVTLGKDKFTLDDFQFSKSDIIDNRPACDFNSGTIQGRKLYSINKTEGTIVADISGGTTGYENFWGNTETQILDYHLATTRYATKDTKASSWEGTYRILVSDSASKSLSYANNEADYSSFSGGHMRITNHEMTSRYEYNLPKIVNDVPDNALRNQSSIEISKTMLPQIERLIVPKFRDTGGHWAEEEINKLYSLDVFEGDTQFFIPDVPMTRAEFTRAVIKACNIRLPETGKKTSRTKNTVPEESIFQDVEVSNPDYQYIKEAVSKGVISGVSQVLFGPRQPLTRAQAITILVRALGFENKAPTVGYYTSFTDDATIPIWSQASIYVAREIGLVQGDSYNRVNPNQGMTRAESSAMLIGFLNFLEQDLQKDYRENIVLYN